MTEPSTLLDGRYRVVATLGRGELGTTYRVEDLREPGVERVVKRFSVRDALGGRTSEGASTLDGPDGFKIVELFEREATILAELSHPRVPRFVDFVTVQTSGDTELFLVQEFVRGRSLAELAREGQRFSEADVVRIGVEVARILQSLHALRPPLVHRDVKPSNILRRDEDGALFLIDFGAVKHRVGTGGLDEATVVGTVGYMSVEQLEGRATTASDVYALGATLVALLTGRAPHELPKEGSRFDLRRMVPVGEDLARVIDVAHSPDAGKRYPEGGALADDLERVARGEAPHLGGSPPVASSPLSRRQRAAVAIAIAAMAAISSAALLASSDRAAGASVPVIEGPQPFAKPATPLPLGPSGRAVPAFFTRYEAEGLVTHLIEHEGDVWAKVDRSGGVAVRFASSDPSRAAVLALPDAPPGLGKPAPIDAAIRTLVERELPGVEIRAVARGEDDALWIATNHSGLQYREGGLWYRVGVAEGLPSNQILDVLVDREGGLWVAAYPTILHADAKDAGERIKSVPRMGARGGTVFESAVLATQELFPDGRASGGVKTLRTEERTLVFFDGRLVHPRPAVGRMPDLVGAVWHRGNAAVFRVSGDGTAYDARGSPTPIPRPPEGRNGFGARGARFDSNGIAWVWGHQRLLSWDGASWTEHTPFERVSVTGAVVAAGGLWVSTDSGDEGTLHRWDGTEWRHFPCQQRAYPTLRSLAIDGLSLLRSGSLLLAVRTSGTSAMFEPAKDEALDCGRPRPTGRWSSLEEDAKGRLWMISIDSGLQIRDGSALTGVGERDGMVSDRLVAITFDGKGRVWLQADDGRVGVYHPEELLRLGGSR